MSRDIDTIPTVPRHIVSFKILVEWSDNPKLVELENEMGNFLDNTFNDWLREIEDEENLSEK
tara:strand:+ start:52 stop:237 length:186 start_codon:yes stop_codon:yes gene_type:complete